MYVGIRADNIMGKISAGLDTNVRLEEKVLGCKRF